MFNTVTKTFEFGQHTVTLETGAIARQATCAVMASMDDTCVLVSVVGKKEAKPGQDFFPLTVSMLSCLFISFNKALAKCSTSIR